MEFPAQVYATFQNVEPCGKLVLLALDVSGSMDGSMIAGSRLTAREASAAMALVTAATEPNCEIIAFSAASGGYGGQWGGGESGITRVAISPRMRLDTVIEKVRAVPMGGTDCALPMIWAARNKLSVSAFVTYTDSETWAGNIHPAQALRQYREEFVGNSECIHSLPQATNRQLMRRPAGGSQIFAKTKQCRMGRKWLCC